MEAETIGSRLGLQAIPETCTTSALISLMVWWARRNLRIDEEICCDALVLAKLTPQLHVYASTLIWVVEFMAVSAFRSVAMVSKMNSGKVFQRRFKMVLAKHANLGNSCWLQASVLFGSVAVLFVGLSNAQDYEAVEKRLGRAVSEGELSLKQATIMMDALRHTAEDEGIEKRLGAIGRRLKTAVAKGLMTEEEAWTKWFEIKEQEIAPRLKAAVKAGEMTEEESWAIWHGIERAEAGERLKAAVLKGELTEEEALTKWEESNRERDRASDSGVEGHFNKLGVSDDLIEKIQERLKESGITDDQVEQTLGGLIRVVYQMRSEGDEIELNPRLRDYFNKRVGLTEEQIELVRRLAMRVVHGMRDSEE